MKPTRIQILRAGYVVGKKKLRTVAELDAELKRRKTTETSLLPSKDAPYRKVAAAVRVLQRRRISMGFAYAVRGDDGKLFSCSMFDHKLTPIDG